MIPFFMPGSYKILAGFFAMTAIFSLIIVSLVQQFAYGNFDGFFMNFLIWYASVVFIGFTLFYCKVK